MSIAEIVRSEELVVKRWASMRAIRPVPVPMSSRRWALDEMGAHAPRSTPSVPTFIAVRS